MPRRQVLAVASWGALHGKEALGGGFGIPRRGPHGYPQRPSQQKERFSRSEGGLTKVPFRLPPHLGEVCYGRGRALLFGREGGARQYRGIINEDGTVLQ